MEQKTVTIPFDLKIAKKNKHRVNRRSDCDRERTK
jgi:hypothetical protein